MRRTLLALALLLVIAFPAIPVSAEDPSDAVVTAQDVITYRNLGAAGDMLVIIHWRWTSGNASATPASSAVTLRLVSSNGTTLAATTPYVYSPFDDNGYGDAISSFYLTDNTTWGQASVIEIVGLPAYFTTPPKLYYTMATADYTDEQSQADNREAMAEYILARTDIFRTIYPLVDLKSTSGGTGTVLSSYGESYFTSVIPGLALLCPELFFIQTYIPDEIATQDYDMELGDNYTARLVGTDLMLGAERVGAYIDVSGYVFFGILTFILCVGIIIFTMAKMGWPLEAPLAICVGVVTGSAILMGSLMFTVIMIIGLLAVIGLSYAILGKRG